jgi:hypothetical protein
MFRHRSQRIGLIAALNGSMLLPAVFAAVMALQLIGCGGGSRAGEAAAVSSSSSGAVVTSSSSSGASSSSSTSSGAAPQGTVVVKFAGTVPNDGPSAEVVIPSGDTISYFSSTASSPSAPYISEATFTTTGGQSVTVFLDAAGAPYQVFNDQTHETLLFHPRADGTGLEYWLFGATGAFQEGAALVAVDGVWYLASIAGLPPGTSVNVSSSDVVSGFDAGVYLSMAPIDANAASALPSIATPAAGASQPSDLQIAVQARGINADSSQAVATQLRGGTVLVVASLLLGGDTNGTGLMLELSGAALLDLGLATKTPEANPVDASFQNALTSQEDAGAGILQAIDSTYTVLFQNGSSAVGKLSAASYSDTTVDSLSVPSTYVAPVSEAAVSVPVSQHTSILPIDQTTSTTYTGTWNWTGPTANGCTANDSGPINITLSLAGNAGINGTINSIGGIHHYSANGCADAGTDSSDTGALFGSFSGTTFTISSMTIATSAGELSFTGTGMLSVSGLQATITGSTGGSGTLSVSPD